MSSWVILGIHGEEVITVQGNKARVRMYINDKEIDEDFDLPDIPNESGVPRNEEVYKYFLTPKIEERIKELEAENV